MSQISPLKTCNVADQFCLAPANIEPLRAARAECYACGEACCTKCSSLRVYATYGRVRLCNDCQVQNDSNDKLVMARMRRMAGIGA